MVKSLRFTGKIDKTPSDGGWHYVLIPTETHAELRQLAGKKGNVPVDVTIGQTTFVTTTMSMGQQRWFFAVKAAVLINVSRANQSRSSLMKLIGTPLYRQMTIRNINTARKLAELI